MSNRLPKPSSRGKIHHHFEADNYGLPVNVPIFAVYDAAGFDRARRKVFHIFCSDGILTFPVARNCWDAVKSIPLINTECGGFLFLSCSVSTNF